MPSPPTETPRREMESLDPADWEEIRRLAHRMIDDGIDHLRDVRSRPVWQDMPPAVREAFRSGLPQEPQPLAQVYDEVAASVMPYPMGNIHPRFWAWYMGCSNITGALADFLAAVQGSNLGGGNHAATLLDNQVVDWLKTMMGFPAEASGSLVSGGSMANLIGLVVARNVMAGATGVDVREEGMAAARPLCFYGSDQLHGCHRKTMETLGLGNNALRRIGTDQRLRIDCDALRARIATDRADGRHPACIIASAGTVNTGAIDDLPGLAAIARDEGLWLHVDGCIGALLAIAPDNAWRVAGLELADSIALDPHKLLHAPFEAGCVLVRDAAAHRKSFAVDSEYLQSTRRGLPSGDWLYELGLQTSRGFRALKIWMALKEHGVDKFGRLIDQTIALAGELARRVAAEETLELVVEPQLNIVCFRYRRPGLDADRLKAVNVEIMLRLQEQGTAAVSDTTVHGTHCLRAAIANYRTRPEDLALLVSETTRIGRTLAS
ncbi:pyridoxal phosphate-dependent decarboxylase family protein [Pseudohoeflea coraliihabitans]|uniref:Amino acid decarboxylase n=1 Tax=Pseudohoeflea coraliihabitans TaxID=2860393 RepID=A0ABS6WRH0_9HYPH|nr:pyridoxal-dependent decarboxylase [Pseudohoeflea sp. DP4N28-3]MBW3098567.1 amino acid decarboxylase [Pseudohoeflea sp. DP4N28-3]